MSRFSISFEKRSSAKAQVIADFIADWNAPGCTGDGPIVEKPWIIHCDGAWGYAGAGIEAILNSPSGIKLRYAARLEFGKSTDRCTNNIAEYEAVLLGLKKEKALGVQNCIIKTDSKVVAAQHEKEFLAHEPHLEKYSCFYGAWKNISKGTILSS